MINRQRKPNAKPGVTSIPLEVFQRGVRVVEGDEVELHFDQSDGREEIKATPVTGDIIHDDVSFRLREIGSRYSVSADAESCELY